eukprot:CAMPEP_0113719212 /NCGR_PEP_ID=MMETSP0038_2-20120614/35662_1 /TAXON_ID=2898 /ORGANISM="Cryptomonas paramecium" /LENGTH=139 /DNA_ID=CAMNT_0000647505 /DNA_START=511 /DNA_END=930 /DNA_ORIENTATION=+ /assembly_acc=CAM_ASM_000170
MAPAASETTCPPAPSFAAASITTEAAKVGGEHERPLTACEPPRAPTAAGGNKPLSLAQRAEWRCSGTGRDTGRADVPRGDTSLSSGTGRPKSLPLLPPKTSAQSTSAPDPEGLASTRGEGLIISGSGRVGQDAGRVDED